MGGGRTDAWLAGWWCHAWHVGGICSRNRCGGEGEVPVKVPNGQSGTIAQSCVT